MCRKVIGVLGVLALMAALAGPAVAQEKDYVWKTDGKRWFRTEEFVQPFVMPKTYFAEVPAAEFLAGEFPSFKYIGKQINGQNRPDSESLVAMDRCDHGDTATGIPILEKKLLNGGFTLPRR